MSNRKPTRAARERSYNVMMAALAEANRVIKLSDEELAVRTKEIHESCFGEQE